MYDKARTTELKFTQETLDTFVRAVVEEGLKTGKPVLCCTTPLALALKLAVVTSGLHAPVANQLMELATTDDYARMNTPADLELVKNFKQGLYGKRPVDLACDRMLTPFFVCEKRLDVTDVRAVAFAPDGKHIASGRRRASEDFTEKLRIFDIETGVYENKNKFFTTSSEINSVAYSPDGKYIAYATFNCVRLINIETGDDQRVVLPIFVHALAYSPDGEHVVCCGLGSGDAFYVLDAKTGAIERRLPHANLVDAVAYSPDGKHVAMGGGFEGVIYVWNLETNELENPINTNTDTVHAVTYSPDGKHIACGADSSVCLFNSESGVLERTLDDRGGTVVSVVYSTDGQFIISGNSIGSLCLWNAKTGTLEKKFRLPCLDSLVESITCSRDGRHFVSACGGHVFVYGLGAELNELDTQEQWQMLVCNAKAHFKNHDDALAAIREVRAVCGTSKVMRGECSTKVGAGGSVGAETPVDQGMRELLERNAHWQDVQRYLADHEAELNPLLVECAQKHIQKYGSHWLTQ
jgi:WD40 repeat protein